MTGTELLDKMELIAPAYIEEADCPAVKKPRRWLGWTTTAACLCLAALMLLQGGDGQRIPGAPVPSPDGPALREEAPDVNPQHPILPAPSIPGFEEPPDPGALVFNQAPAALDASRRYIPGYFTKALTQEELAGILPRRQAAGMTVSAEGGFDGEGRLLEVFLTVEAPFLREDARVIFSQEGPLRDYEIDGEPVVCVFHSVPVTLYQWSADGARYTLDAYAQINGWDLRLTYEAAAEELGRAIRDFEVLILCFLDYDQGQPDLSVIGPGEIPDFVDEQLSLEAALLDGDFGGLMISEVPEGFAAESIRRYRDQKDDYLSGLWTKGLSSLSWRVSFFTEEDRGRLTGVEQTERYDLSRYPIPRADSVPEELREVVDDPIFAADELTSEVVLARAYTVEETGDAEGWRMAFSVRYGDLLVEVRTKGVDPQWVYEQLSDLR